MNIKTSVVLIVFSASGPCLLAQTSTDLNYGLDLRPSSAPGEFEVSWWGDEDKLFVLENSTTLLTPWIGFHALIGTGSVESYIVSSSADSGFYRVAVEREPFVADRDGDQLPDGWEVRHGLDPFNPEPPGYLTSDGDSDGWNNLLEATLGTDPTKGRAATTPDTFSIRVFTPVNF